VLVQNVLFFYTMYLLVYDLLLKLILSQYHCSCIVVVIKLVHLITVVMVVVIKLVHLITVVMVVVIKLVHLITVTRGNPPTL
jgi:hypothetical protein